MRWKVKRIGLCGRRVTSYDDVMLNGLADGFRQCEVAPVVLSRCLSGAALDRFCRFHHLDAVLEINRGRPLELSRDIKHIAWFQDPVTVTGETGESDISYYLTGGDILGYDTARATGLTGLLYTGVSPSSAVAPRQLPISDFTFVGYMPTPFLSTAYTTPLIEGRDRPTLADVVDAFSRGFSPSGSRMTVGDLHVAQLEVAIRRVLNDEFGVGKEFAFHYSDTVAVFEQKVVRALDRIWLIDTILEVSTSLRLYGLNWHVWPKYRRYDGGFLRDPDDVADAFRTTRINLHNNPNGFGMHSRVLDCMACGMPIMVARSPYDHLAGGIQTEFSPDEHYIPYSLSTLADIAKRWLGDEDGRQRIGERAQRLLLSKHTWRHRAEQVLADIKRL